MISSVYPISFSPPHKALCLLILQCLRYIQVYVIHKSDKKYILEVELVYLLVYILPHSILSSITSYLLLQLFLTFSNTYLLELFHKCWCKVFSNPQSFNSNTNCSQTLSLLTSGSKLSSTFLNSNIIWILGKEVWHSRGILCL